jgi:outer membrane protein assembly factor BamE
MRMLSFFSNRVPAAAALLLAAFIAGCASKNPLIDEPATVSKSPASPAASRAQAAAPVQTAETKIAPESAGVQTTRQRRFFGIFSPYRPDIQQGNFVSKEMVAQLKEGMTPDQVRFVLGTPLLTDIFHANRWDYPFRLVQGNGKVTSSRVTVWFKDNRLARIEGGDLPTEKDFLALISGAAPAPKPTAVPATQQTPPTAVDETINRQEQ